MIFILRQKIHGLGFILAISIFSGTSLYSVPATPYPIEKVQPDGTKVTIFLRGDNFFNWNEDPDGYAVKKDQGDGFWKYAKPSGNAAQMEVIQGARLGKSDPKLLGLKKKDLPRLELIVQKVKKKWGEKYSIRVRDKLKFLKDRKKDSEKEKQE